MTWDSLEHACSLPRARARKDMKAMMATRERREDRQRIRRYGMIDKRSTQNLKQKKENDSGYYTSYDRPCLYMSKRHAKSRTMPQCLNSSTAKFLNSKIAARPRPSLLQIHCPPVRGSTSSRPATLQSPSMHSVQHMSTLVQDQCSCRIAL